MTPAAARRAARRHGFAVVLLAAWALAWAQPYLAGGGFGRPQRLADLSTRGSLALATDGSSMVAAVVTLDGVVTMPVLPSPGPGTLAVASDSVRAVDAAVVAGDLALAWAMRDRTTGRTHVLVRWRGRTTEIHDGLELLPFRLVGDEGVPWLAFAPRADGEAVLQLRGVDGRQRTVRRTPLTVTGIDAAAAPDGALWVSWLEGIRESTPLGLRSDWTAYLARVGADGSVGPATALGAASADGRGDHTAVAAGSEGARVLYPDAAGSVRSAHVAADGTVRVSRAWEAGVPLAWAGERAFWTHGTSVRALAPADAAPLSVAWSPVTIEGAAAAAADGVEALAWFGSEIGGDRPVYLSSDASPFRPEWQDRIAATMGWNPWYLWTEAGGQALTSLLVGVLGTVALFPLLWLGALLLPRLAPAGERMHGAVGGASMAAAVLLAGWLLVSWRSAAVLGRRYVIAGGPGATAAALALAVLVSLLALRRGDRDTHASALAAAGLTACIALTVMAFLAFPGWSPLVGLRGG